MPAAGSELLPNLHPGLPSCLSLDGDRRPHAGCLLAEHRRLMEETYSGGLVGYVLGIPFLTLVAAQGVARRRDDELPIHDRQTDLIVGFMGMVLALLVKGVLLDRYADQYDLLRLDLLAMWLFVVSAAVTTVRSPAGRPVRLGVAVAPRSFPDRIPHPGDIARRKPVRRRVCHGPVGRCSHRARGRPDPAPRTLRRGHHDCSRLRDRDRDDAALSERTGHSLRTDPIADCDNCGVFGDVPEFTAR